MKWDQVRWFVIGHLLVAFHKDKGSVRRKFIFTTLRNVPSLFLIVLDVAMISRDSLQLDLDLSLHRSSYREVVGLVGLKDNFFLNEVLVLIRADPSWAGSQSWRILATVNVFFNVVIISGWSHYIECRRWSLAWLSCVGNFVEVIVYDLTQVDEGVILDLNRSIHIHLYARGVNNTEISNIIFSILADNHKLGFPKFLVVRNLIVVGFTLTNFEHSLSAIDRNFEILEFFSVDAFKSHMKLVGCGLIW